MKKDTAPEGNQSHPTQAREKLGGPLSRLKLRHIVYGSLVSSGAMTLGAWNAQAHGNRSSHESANILWGVDRFIVNRQRFLAPTAAPTLRLCALVDRITFLRGIVPGAPACARAAAGVSGGSASITATESAAAIADTDSSCDSKGNDGGGRSRIVKELRKLTAERDELESRLALTPITKRVFGLLSQGREREAINVIEGAGDRHAILSAYIWAQLDLYNAGFDGVRSTPKFVKEIAFISRSALSYYDTLPGKTKEIKRAGAALMHNFASFSLPDEGEAPRSIQAEGRVAAQRALRLRTELGESSGILYARLMVGIEAFRADAFRDAEHDFRAALKLAMEIGDGDGAAWSGVQLARTLLANNVGSRSSIGEATFLLASARQHFAADCTSLAMIDQLVANNSAG